VVLQGTYEEARLRREERRIYLVTRTLMTMARPMVQMRQHLALAPADPRSTWLCRAWRLLAEPERFSPAVISVLKTLKFDVKTTDESEIEGRSEVTRF
jgi:hypothetical protein